MLVNAMALDGGSEAGAGLAGMDVDVDVEYR